MNWNWCSPVTVSDCFNVLPVTQLNLGCEVDWLIEWSLILAMAIVGLAKYTHTRARACVYFARPTIAIAKLRDYSQSNQTQMFEKSFVS